MFRKPFSLKSCVQMKGSEKKKLCGKLKETPGISEKLEIEIFQNAKSDGTVSKINCFDGKESKFYCSEKVPYVFEFDNKLAPTLFLLWRYPEMLHIYIIPEDVFSKLQQGADIMLPGVITGPDPSQSLGNLAKGSICAVSILCNDRKTGRTMIKGPIGIGETLMSSSDMLECGMKGKGIRILHLYKDWLFENSPTTSIPPVMELTAKMMEEAKDVIEAHDSDDNNEQTTSNIPATSDFQEKDEGPTKMAEADKSEGTENKLEEMNISDNEGEKSQEEEEPISEEDYLITCFLVCLKKKMKKVELPVLASTFLNSYLLPSVPANRKIEVGKTKYKKFGTFLKDMEKDGLIEVIERKKGVLEIAAINWASQLIKLIEVPDDLELEQEEEPKNPLVYKPPLIEEWSAITGNTLSLFRKYNPTYSKGDLLSREEVRNIVTRYVKEEELQIAGSAGMLLLDDFMMKAVGGKERELGWNGLFNRVFSALTTSYKLTWSDGREQVRKTLPKVNLEVATRAGNKKVTMVNNLIVYGIQPEEFSKKVQRGIACSGTVNKTAVKCEGPQVLFQGNQVNFIERLLCEEYQLDKKYIEGLDLGVKMKKKKK